MLLWRGDFVIEIKENKVPVELHAPCEIEYQAEYPKRNNDYLNKIILATIQFELKHNQTGKIL